MSLSVANVQFPCASPQDTTTYTVIVQDSIGCSGTDSIVVSVLIIPLVTASADTAICLGDAITISATGNGTYLWSTGETTQSITAAPTNDSLYIVSSNNACGSDSDSIWVLVNLPPSASAGADITIYLGESVPLNGSGGPAYSWVPTTGLDCPTCENPTASPLETTTYYLTVTDPLGCSITDTVVVTVDITKMIFISNIFSPNGDAENDIFYVQGLGIQELNMIIFDRWGEKVFENTGFQADDKDTGWDGTFKGKLMNPAVFVYMVTGTFIDGSEINEKGDLTLVK
jgi:gliding motility-associated-like protein